MYTAVQPGNYKLSDPTHYSSGYAVAPLHLHYTDHYIDPDISGSDEFRMYDYKVKRCTRLRSHDWTECPYAHCGEKAQRRDPRRYAYHPIVCPAYRAGHCHKGEHCELAHGVFEFWLHPYKYRTRVCNEGPDCHRKVCFFAHTTDELRPEPKYLRKYQNYYPSQQYPNYMYRPVQKGKAVVNPPPQTAEEYEMRLGNKRIMDEPLDKADSFLNSLRALKLSDDIEAPEYDFGEGGKSWGGVEKTAAVPEVKFDWIAELLQ